LKFKERCHSSHCPELRSGSVGRSAATAAAAITTERRENWTNIGTGTACDVNCPDDSAGQAYRTTERRFRSIFFLFV